MARHEKMCEDIITIILDCERKILKELNCKTMAKIYGKDRSYLSRIFKECRCSYL
jgi:AraC-like DNA-binding protein